MIADFNNIRKKVVHLILLNPRARERKLRNQAIGSILLKKYNLEIPQKIMAEIVRDSVNGVRAWQDFLAKNPTYRGSDYFDEKRIMAEEHQVALGYVPELKEVEKILKNL